MIQDKPILTMSLGYQGATDSCLCLSDGKTIKQFGIESDSWLVIEKHWNIYNGGEQKVIPGEQGYEELLGLMRKDTSIDEF